MLHLRLRRPAPLTIAVIVVVVVSVVRFRGFDFGQSESDRTEVTAVVARVIDGDTLDLTDGRRIRLLGIDAPERGYDGAASEPLAEESTDWLTRRLDGHTVRLQIGTTPTDRYGRTLAWIFDSNGSLVNRDSLEAGMSRLLDSFGLPADLEPQLRQAAATARIQKAGIWNRGKAD